MHRGTHTSALANKVGAWRLQTDMAWVVAAGAKHKMNDELLLMVEWSDGYARWVDRYALHVRPHCLLKLVRFYESKAKPRNASLATQPAVM